MKKIKKTWLFVVCSFLAFSFNGCKDVKLLTVEETLDGGTIEFILSPQSSMDYDVAKDASMNVEELLKPYKLSMDNIKSLNLESANVEILDSLPTPLTFDIADNMSVELGAPTIPLTKIAFKDPVPHDASKNLSLDIQNGVDMIPYAKANTVNYHMKLKLNQVLTHPVLLKVNVKWKVVGEI